jgi:hypothetical protein
MSQDGGGSVVEGEPAERPALDVTSTRNRAGGQQGAGRTAVQTRKVISVGSVSLEAADLSAAREEIDRLLGRYGGRVTDEETVNDDDGEPERSTLRLRVPSVRFDAMMGAFDDLATVTRTDREAADVTTEVIDVDARIRTQEVSLERLRRFLGEARDVGSMIRLESEIAQREADLGSLRAQQEYLEDQTSLATIKVDLTRAPRDGQDVGDPLEDAGFLSGLRTGWDALVDVVVVTGTVLGALTPFAVVLALVGVPGWLWLRATRRRRTVPAA